MGATAIPWFADRREATRLLRYGVASTIALACDYAVFLCLLRLALPPVAASTLGYVAGIVVHWQASTRAVFAGQVAQAGAARARQRALFLATALAGLAATAATVAIGTLAGADPRLAKLAAVGASFLLTWQLRRRIVFA